MTIPTRLPAGVPSGHPPTESPHATPTYGTYGTGLTENPLTPRSHGSSSVPHTRVRRTESELALSTGRPLRDRASSEPPKQEHHHDQEGHAA